MLQHREVNSTSLKLVSCKAIVSSKHKVNLRRKRDIPPGQKAGIDVLGAGSMALQHLQATFRSASCCRGACGRMNLRHAESSRSSSVSGHGGQGHAYHGSPSARTGTIASTQLESEARGVRGSEEICAELLPCAVPGGEISRTHADPPCQGTASAALGAPTPHFLRRSKYGKDTRRRVR